MVSWEGGFSWQGYALSGRPDFLNYLNAGDVTWEKLWDFYRQATALPAAMRSLMRNHFGSPTFAESFSARRFKCGARGSSVL